MTLYTVNDIYPDKDFAWEVAAEDLTLSPSEHSHLMSSIAQLVYTLSYKSAIDHDHTAFKVLTVNGESPIGVVTLQGSGLSITGDGGELTLNLLQTSSGGDIVGMRNVNPDRQHTTVRVSSSNVALTDASEAIVFVAETLN
jgi:hypothetical protein